MQYKDEAQAEEMLNETLEAYKPIRDLLITRIAIDRCMYEGCHWISHTGQFTTNSQTGRRFTNWNPDSNKLVATANKIPPLIRECAAATFPEKIETDVSPPDRDMGIEAAEKARVLECALNAAVDATGYLGAANDANFRRCIDGSHGIGLRIKIVPGNEEYDQILTAFAFDPTKLTLDPFNQSRDLRDHDHVTYSDVWTLDAIRKNFGMELDPNECQTVGELCQLQLQMNKLSENRLYANLPKYSKTKGAVVHQIHAKDDSGRFSTMLIGIKSPPMNGRSGLQWVNFANQETPFGGETALPFTLLHGAQRPDSMWAVSDAHLLKDDQDRINLLTTFLFRQLQKNAGFQWLVDSNAIDGKDVDNFKQQFNNYVAGVITYKGAVDRNRPVTPPQMVQTPQPPPFIQELVAGYQQEMRKNVHRADVTTGVTKSHVPNAVYQTALDEANQVLGNRIREDMRSHEGLLGTVLGTTVKLAQDGSPSALAFLRRYGFDAADFSQIALTDPRYPACSIRIRESSIRYQSREEKEARLWKAVELQALPPQKIRLALADMDTPLDDADKAMFTAARKAAVRVLLGEEWQGMMLGEYGDMFVAEFRRAAFDRRAELDPEARARLARAIEVQLAYTNMETQQTAMAQQPPAPETAAPEATQEQQQMPQEVNIADLLTSLNGGSGSAPASAQPEAA